MIDSSLTLDINPFGAMLSEATAMLDTFAQHAAMAGDRLSRGLFGGSSQAQINQGANVAAGSIRKAGQAAQTAASQVAQSGQKAAQAASGYHAHASAANQAGSASTGFAAKVGHTLHTLSQAGHTLAGLVHGVHAVHTVFAYFKGTHQPVQQTAAAVQAVAHQTTTAVAPARRWTAIIVGAGAAAAATAGSVWLLHKAYHALSQQRTPKLAVQPPATGRGIGSILGSPAAAASMLIPGLGQMIAGALAGVGISALIGKALGKAAERQKTELQMGIVLNDTDQAKHVIEDLKHRSDRTTHTEDHYIREGRALIGMGVAAKDVGNTLDRLGNIAAGSDAALGDLVSQYGRWKSKGAITREELDQLAADGVPVLQQLSKQMGKNIATIQQMGEDGKVSFNDVNAALTALTSNGGQFEGMMMRNATTISGIWDTLKSKIASVLADFGEPINNAIKAASGKGGGFLDQALQAVDLLRAKATEFGVQVAASMKRALAAFQELGTGGVIDLLRNQLILAFKTATNTLHAGLAGVSAAWGVALQTAIQVAMKAFEKGSFIDVMVAKMNAFGDSMVASGKRFIATLLEGMAKVPGFGGSGGLAKDYRKDADRLEQGAAVKLKKALSGFVPDTGALQKMLFEGAAKVAAAFRQGRDAASDIMSASAEQQAVNEAMERISARAIQNMVDGWKQEEASKLKGGLGDKAGAPGTPSMDRTPGGFAQAINLLMGRSIGELALDEAKRQTKLLEQVVKNTSTKPAHPSPAPAAVIDPTPRFW